MEKKRVTLSSESLNRNGYRVLTSGIRLETFRKNPAMFLGHMSWGMPIGRWDDLKIEGDKLTAVPVFDENDPLAVAAKSKFENGFLFATSIAFRTLQTSDKPEHLLKGQKYATVTECELMEASFVGIPGNPDATLDAHDYQSTGDIPAIFTNSDIQMDFKKLAQALGLADSADETAILAAIADMKNQSASLSAARADALLALGLQNGTVTEANKEAFRKLALADFDNTKALIEAKPAATPAPAPATGGTSLLGMIANGQPKGDGKTDDPRKNWTLDQWSKKDPNGLLAMKASDPARYLQLAQNRLEATMA